MARRVLVLVAHPALERSRMNRRLLAATEALEGVSVRDLYELYPDLDVDPHAEQAALSDHDIVVFQHPFYWYSVPAILKQWQDLVLSHGWAYGAGGRALEGKTTFHVITTGAPEMAYVPETGTRFTVRQFLAPWEATANLCRMAYLPPYVVHGAHKLEPVDLDPHVAAYRQLLTALIDGADLSKATTGERLNDHLSAVLAGRPS